MTLYGEDRRDELERVQRRLGNAIRREAVKVSGNISWIEGYAAAVRAIEEQARAPTEKIRQRARDVSAYCSLETGFAADAYQRQRDEATARAGAEQERRIWTQAIETYFDGTAVMDVERYVEEIRKGVEAKP